MAKRKFANSEPAKHGGETPESLLTFANGPRCISEDELKARNAWLADTDGRILEHIECLIEIRSRASGEISRNDVVALQVALGFSWEILYGNQAGITAFQRSEAHGLHQLGRDVTIRVAKGAGEDPERLLRQFDGSGTAWEELRIAVEEPQPPPKSPSKKPRKATVNERMLSSIQDDQERIGWSTSEWAKHLKCAKSTVAETEIWKTLKIQREGAKAERRKDRRRKPKASEMHRD